MYKAVTLSFFLFLILNASAQRKQVDSLLQLLTSVKADSSKAAIYTEIGKFYTYNNNDIAIAYFGKSIALLKRLDKPLKLAGNYYSLGHCYLEKSNYAKSLENYLLSVGIYENLKDSFRLANAFMSIANVYSYNSDFKKVLEYDDKAQALIMALKDSTFLSNFAGQKGNFYGQQQRYDSALFYYKQGYAIAKAMNNRYGIINSLSNIGLTYKHQHNTIKALACFDSVMVIHKKNALSPDILSMVYNNIAATYSQMGNYTMAKKNFDSSITIASEAGFPDVVMENYRNLADMYGNTNDYGREVYYLKKYHSLKDSLFTRDTKNQLTELEADYQIGQKNSELVQKQGEVEKQKNERNLFLIIAVAAALVLLLLIVFYRRINRKNLLLTEKNSQINEQKEELQQTLQHLKNTQSQLIQSEKMASLGELTAGIAHEIQNPLNFVNNFSELNRELLNEMKDEAEKGNLDEVKAIANDLIENEQKINHHGKRADSIVKGMLQHSRQTKGVKEPTDINKLCDEYLRLSYHGLRAKDKGFNADFKTDFDENLSADKEGFGKINIVPQDIGRVLLNLFNNAFYAVSEKQKTADKNYKPLVTVSTKSASPLEKGWVEVVVSDNGNGIPQNIIDKIFQPFFTTKPTGQGTGLGLSLSYDIIKAHGGDIKAETKEGEGTTFNINLTHNK